MSDNVYAGTAMARRAVYMYGAALPKGADGQLAIGLGRTAAWYDRQRPAHHALQVGELPDPQPGPG